jgi:hypothetical protein
MSAEHLNAAQFPIEEVHKWTSSDFGTSMKSVGPMLRSEYNHWASTGEENIARGDPHSQDIKHGGPDNYVAHLAEDIKQHGIKNPISVRHNRDAQPTVMQGHHRYLAAVKAGLTHVPVHDWLKGGPYDPARHQ